MLSVLVSFRKNIFAMLQAQHPPSPAESLSEKSPLTSSPSLTSTWSEDRKPRASRAAILHSKKGPYTYTSNHTVPALPADRVLIRVRAIGLNPIDWKCVTYGFGIHDLPWLSGREAAGTIEEVGSKVSSKFARGDRVWVASTNYRDNSTSTFQEVSLPVLNGAPLSSRI